MEKQVFAGVTNDQANTIADEIISERETSGSADRDEAQVLATIPNWSEFAAGIAGMIASGSYEPFGSPEILALALVSLGMRYQAALATHATKRTKTRVSGGAA